MTFTILSHPRISFLHSAFCFLLLIVGCNTQPSRDGAEASALKPNIVYILADDMGYGDVSCYNPKGKIRTPSIDRLASQGMRFTDAHSPASVCTPTRYAILTGQYPWRSRLAQGVLRGYGRSLIAADSYTVGSFLQQQGYHTGVVGKWHLGLDWSIKPGHEHALEPGSYAVNESGLAQDMDPAHINFKQPPAAGPLHRGFDYSFILPASLDMDPYCYLENDTLTDLPSAHTSGNDLNTGYTGAFWRAGKMAPSFEFDQVLGNFTGKAIAYLEARAAVEKPFFLYLPFAAPHTPWVPTPEYQGKSGAGAYGDFVQMVDAAIGKVLKTLDSLQLAENTIVIFASDNGPFWRPESIENFDHRAAGEFRGMKADVWEGGHRIPFIVRWPGKIKPGTVSTAPTTLTNLGATCSDILQVALPPGSAQDSYSVLPVLTQQSDTVPLQRAIVHHSSMGYFAIRQGHWKLIERRGSGGFSEPQQYQPGPGEPKGQLYDLGKDPGEMENLYDEFPGKVQQLQKILAELRGH
jgi:arylsulfatase A